MKDAIFAQLKNILKDLGIEQAEFSLPPKPEMGDMEIFFFKVFEVFYGGI